MLKRIFSIIVILSLCIPTINSEKSDIEKEIMVKACSEYINPETVVDNWNLEMINHSDVDDSNINTKIKIAIIDSGIDECEGLSVKERYNFVPDEEGVLPVYDDFTGHGTAIAGIIASNSTSDREIRGINPNVELYSIKVLDGKNEAPMSRLIQGIEKAIECDVNIINLSLGTTQGSKELHNVIKKAYSRGILIVASEGNDGEKLYPAAYKEVIGVGSIDAMGNVSDEYENVDIVAPGELVKTVANFGMETVSSGTSIAVPHVVGVASVLWEQNIEKDADFIRNLLIDSAKDDKYKILDEEYALESYDEYSEYYNDESYNLEENDSELNICDDMIKVSAKWSKDNHEALVSSANGGLLTTKQLNMVKIGIRYNDVRLSDVNIWHAIGSDSDYMAATYMVGKVIQDNSISPANVTKAPGLTTTQWNQMKSNINAVKSGNWASNVLAIKNLSASDYPYSDQYKRLVLFGMSLHIVTDTFAHRAYKRKDYLPGNDWSHWEHIGSPDTDDTSVVTSRYLAAGKVVKNAFDTCLNASSVKNSYTIRSKQFMQNNNYFDTTFLLKDLVNYAYTNRKIDSSEEGDNTYNTYKNLLCNNTYALNYLDSSL